jgi:hypothetical protein
MDHHRQVLLLVRVLQGTVLAAGLLTPHGPAFQDLLHGLEREQMPYGLVAVLASAGCVETAYLAIVRTLLPLCYDAPAWHRMASAAANLCTGPWLRHVPWHAQSKLLQAPVTCPTAGSCDTVLNSGYASVFGLPLPLLGADPSFDLLACRSRLTAAGL